MFTLINLLGFFIAATMGYIILEPVFRSFNSNSDNDRLIETCLCILVAGFIGTFWMITLPVMVVAYYIRRNRSTKQS